MRKGVAIANIILGSGGVFYALTFVYGLYRYVHEDGKASTWGHVEKVFTSLTGMLLYSLVSVIVACLLFACLRLAPSRRINLALLVLSTCGSFYTGEVILEYLVLAPIYADRPTLAKKAGIDFDARSRREVLLDLREKGVDAYPIVYPFVLLGEQADGTMKSEISIGGLEALPLAGIANKVTVYGNEIGQHLVYESDEFGFHNPKGMWSLGKIEIVAIGDSFTHGCCVPSDRNSIALIRKRYPGTLNLGMGGSGPLLMLAVIREYVDVIRPKVVLWFYYEGNDLGDVRNEKKSALLMKYLESGFRQNLFHRQGESDREIVNYVEVALARGARLVARRPADRGVIFSWRLLRVVKLQNVRTRLGLTLGRAMRPEISSGSEADLHLFREILLQAKASVSAWGGRLYFVYLPEFHRYKSPMLANSSRERVLGMVGTIGLPIIDIHRVFSAERDPLAFWALRVEGSHYSVEGYRVVAEEVLRTISVSN